MTTTTPAAFWIDHDYDREHASDGVSRYGAYLRDGQFDPSTDDDQHVELAEFAWRRATPPVMSPGYVRRHPRILAAQLERSDWDGSLLATVDLVIPHPEPLRWLAADQAYSGGVWQDWPSEHSFTAGRTLWHEPGSDDICRGPHLLCTASLRFALPSAELPQPPLRWRHRGEVPADALLPMAQESVAVAVRELNAIVGPVLRAVER